MEKEIMEKKLRIRLYRNLDLLEVKLFLRTIKDRKDEIADLINYLFLNYIFKLIY
jgi:hypothetical protein